jgi:hypothetical protein
VLEWFPDIEPRGLTGAGVFWDGQMDNPPRLVWAFVHSPDRRSGELADMRARLARGAPTRFQVGAPH